MTDYRFAAQEGQVSREKSEAPGDLDVVSIYRRHHDFVWRSLRAMGLSETTADDVLQEVFLVVHRRIEDFDPRQEMRAWLYGIARMKAKSRHSKEAKRKRVETPLGDGLEEKANVNCSTVPGQEVEMENAVAYGQGVKLIQRFLASLDDPQREVFSLIEIENCSAPEVAEMLGVKLNTVYSRLRLARSRLQIFADRHRQVHKREGRYV